MKQEIKEAVKRLGENNYSVENEFDIKAAATVILNTKEAAATIGTMVFEEALYRPAEIVYDEAKVWIFTIQENLQSVAKHIGEQLAEDFSAMPRVQ